MSDKKPKKRGRKPGKHYVSSNDLIREIRIYYDEGIFTKQLGLYILRIAEGISNSPNFTNYSYLDEMMGDAIWRMSKAITDKICKIIDDDLIGTPAMDDEGNIIYMKNADGEYIKDEDGNYIPKPIMQNNVFGYFSMISWRAFQHRINIEKKYMNTSEEYKNEVFKNFEEDHGIAPTSKFNQDNEYYE